MIFSLKSPIASSNDEQVSKIGSGCTRLGSVCPGVKSSPLTPKHSLMGQISLLFCMGWIGNAPYSWCFSATSTAALRANKVQLECERVLSARVSDLMWTSVWSGNLLSSEVISLTQCIVKWWGGLSHRCRISANMGSIFTQTGKGFMKNFLHACTQ